MQNRWVGFVVALSVLALAGGAWAAPKDTAVEARPPSPAKPRATKIKVTIDAAEMTLTISPFAPAFIGDERWSHALAIVATDRTATSVTFNIAAFAKADDRAKITNAQVIQQASLKQQVTDGKALSIVPGKTLARALFGAAPPKRIVITWVAN